MREYLCASLPNQDQHRPRRSAPELRRQAAAFRRWPTRAEASLWHHLRNRKLGVKVRRQHPIGPFIADFCIVEHRLIIEIDGAVHAEQHERDAERTRFLNAAGYRVVRFTNEQALNATAVILTEIQSLLAGLPSPARGRGVGDEGT